MQDIVYGDEESTAPQAIGLRPIVLALGLGIGWALLGVFLGYRLGWLAPVIGAGLGLFTQKLQLTPSRGAWLALWLTVLALVVGRGLACAGGAWYVSSHEIHADPYLVYEAVLADVSAQGPTIDEERLTERELHGAVMARLEKLTDSQKRSIVREYIDSSDTPVVRTQQPHSLFRLWDIIGWGLALTFAYHMGALVSGWDEEEMEPDPHDDRR